MNSGQLTNKATHFKLIEINSLVQAYLAAWSTPGDSIKLSELVTDDYVFEDHGDCIVKRGKVELCTFVSEYLRAFPSFLQSKAITIAHQFDKVTVEWILSGTHTGDYPGMPATFKSFSVTGVSLLEFRAGKISRDTTFFNLYDVFQQLELLPTVSTS